MTQQPDYTTPELVEIGELTDDTLGHISVGPEPTDMKELAEDI